MIPVAACVCAPPIQPSLWLSNTLTHPLMLSALQTHACCHRKSRTKPKPLVLGDILTAVDSRKAGGTSQQSASKAIGLGNKHKVLPILPYFVFSPDDS
jgi:hypothetical protein